MQQTLAFLTRYGRGYLPWYGAGVIALAITNWLSVSIPVVLAEGIDALGAGTADASTVLWAAATVGLMGAAVIVVRTASRLLFFTPGRLVEAQVKHDVFQKVLEHQPSFLAGFPPGDLMNRMTSDGQIARLLFGFVALGLVNTVVALTFTATQMALMSPSLAGAVVVPLFVGFAITLFFVQKLFRVHQRIQEANSALSDHVLSTYQGIATAKAFGAEDQLLADFDVHNQEALISQLIRANLRVAIGPVLSLATSFNVFLLLWFGGPMVMQGTLSIGELVAFTALVGYLSAPLRGMTFILGLLREAQASIERLDAVLLAEPLRPDLPNPHPAPDRPPSLRVRNLTFAYGDDKPALVDVSFAIEGGKTVGIFGPTGSGKTTLLRCLLRLEDPPPSSIWVGDQDVRSLDLSAWRRAATLVPQKAALFSESLEDNILLGSNRSEELDVLLSRAQLATDVRALPDGLQTVVGESGLTLSGGQRQRVALARGLLRDHQVLVLDDVLSAVDHATEAALIASIHAVSTPPTTVIVSNRISAIRHADRVVVLDAGRVVGFDTPDALLEQPGIFRDAWLRQQSAA